MPIPDHERLTRHFFRGVNSVSLFQRFFQGFGVTLGFRDLPPGANDVLADLWEGFEHERRAEMEEALQRINDIGRERGRYVLAKAAADCGLDATDLSVQKLAMCLFLNHPQAFQRAYGFYVLEKTPNLHTLLGNRPLPCTPTDDQVERFKTALVTVLAQEGQGPRLKVEIEAGHPDKWMAAIPHEHHVRPDHVFAADERIVTQDRRPVYELVLIYYPETGVLKLQAGRGRKLQDLVAATFAREVLGQGEFHFAPCVLVRLDRLAEPGLTFSPVAGDPFDWALPVRIRFTEHSDSRVEREVALTDPRPNDVSVLEILEQDGVDLRHVDVMSLSVLFKFPGGNRKRRTVELSVPAGIPLDETARDRALEQVLIRWGLIDHEAKQSLARAGLPR